MPLLSVIIPVYNEAKTIRQVIEKVYTINIDKEIVVVDDGSTDGTDRILHEIRYNNLKVVYHGGNRGKGAALLTGLANAGGEFVIVQDADFEYDPQEYIKLMEEMLKNKADLVLGVRFTKGYHGLLIPRFGNKFLTTLINILFGAKLNDFFTCYKLCRRDTFNALDLKSKNFDIDVEIVTKALKNKLRIEQVPISYHPRTYAQGKKIRWLDGMRAMLSIIKYRLIS
jgi:glycosyltransferase involved in cell wall biosynthesis